MNVVIRADASAVMGVGHIMRSLTLAEGLRVRDAAVQFVCRRHEGNLIGLIKQRNFSVVELAAPEGEYSFRDDSAHAQWIGAHWRDDALQTIAAIETLGNHVDWLVVDHYGLDHKWESMMRSTARRVFVVDDLADRRHDCDVLLDQNLVEDFQSRYLNKAPLRCRLMLGPRYALLSPLYLQMRQYLPPRDGKIRKILISFGGFDRHDLAVVALRAFLQLGRPDIELDIVVSHYGRTANAVRAAAHGLQNVRVHIDAPTLAPLIATADLAIGAVGSTSWERLCLGLYAIAITTAENQIPLAVALHSRGLIEWLGHCDQVSLEKLRDAMRQAIERGVDQSTVRECLQVVDGAGLQRVLTTMLLDLTTRLIARYATAEDEVLLLEWANDLTTRQNSLSSSRISEVEHHRWFCTKLEDRENCKMYIVETMDAVAVGQVRFERENTCWAINYSIAAPYRGIGLGRRIIDLALVRFFEHHREVHLIARVAASNAASHKVFSNMGFVATTSSNGIAEYRLATRTCS